MQDGSEGAFVLYKKMRKNFDECELFHRDVHIGAGAMKGQKNIRQLHQVHFSINAVTSVYGYECELKFISSYYECSN